MWQQLWKKWTLDKPAAFGDLLWEVFVVQLAAWLDQLTPRRFIALVPVVILILAYAHRIPIPPELMLVGDVLAYIDVFSVILLISVMSRVATIVFVMQQAAARAIELASKLRAGTSGLDFRHRREGRPKGRKGTAGRTKNENDDPAAIRGVAWA